MISSNEETLQPTKSHKIFGTEFSIEFLTEKLIECCKCDRKLISWRCEQIAKGQGFLSIIVKVDMHWENNQDKKLPNQVIVKTPFQDNLRDVMKDIMPQEMIDQMLNADSINTMKTFYTNEIVALEFFNDPARSGFTPKLYFYKVFTDSNDQGYVVMESFADTGCLQNMCDGFSVNQVKSVIRALTSMQACAILDTSWKGKLLGMDPQMIDQWAQSTSLSKDALVAMKPDKFQPLVAQLEWLFTGDTMKRFMNTSDDGDEKGCSLMVHGDMHGNNILFARNEEGMATDELVALIDWQIAHPGNVMEDLVRLVFMLNTEDRIRETDGLIQYYHQQLVARLGAHQCPISIEYMNKTWKQYFQLGTLFQMMFCPMMSKMASFAGTQARIDNMVERTQRIMIECIELEKNEGVSKWPIIHL